VAGSKSNSPSNKRLLSPVSRSRKGIGKYFGSLLVGYQGLEGLLFTARVGTCFSEKPLASIGAQLQKLSCAMCPFITLPEKTKGG
jgi:hypothetical protein